MKKKIRMNLARRTTLIISILLLVVSSSIGLAGVVLSTKTIRENTNEVLNNAVSDGVMIVEATLAKNLDALVEIANNETTYSMFWPTQQRYLKDDIDRLGFLDIGVAGLDGVVRYVSDGSETDLSERGYIQKALQGEANVSDVLISEVTNEAVVMLAVPIKIGDTIVGALVARRDGMFLSKITENMGFGEQGYAFILGSDGVTYAHSNKDFVIGQKNILEDEDTRDIGNAITELGIGNKGIINYTFLGSKRIMGIEPMETNDWILAVGAYESDVFAGLAKLRIALLIGIAIFMVLGIIVAFYFGSSISKPMVEYSRIIERLADYDLTFDENSKAIKYLKRTDEIGNIGNSLVTMQRNLIDLVGEISNVAQQVASSSQELTATSEQSAVASEEVARAIEDIAQGATDQAKATERGAMSVGDLGKQIQENIQGVVNLNNAAEKIHVLKDEGIEIIKELVQKTKDSSDASKNIYEIILNTNESTVKIEKASEMIKSIADQTNLLALNATIEAARAGEAGRGFAVVADEIRTLAEQSNNFTSEIDMIIRELAEKTGNAVTQMKEVGEIVASQTNSVDITNNKFEGIANSIEEVRELAYIIGEINGKMEGERDQVIQVIEHLSSISEENAAGTEEASASVEEQTASMGEIAHASEALAQLANEMQESVIKFKI